jgi:outer membrane protein assembly factor BamB
MGRHRVVAPIISTSKETTMNEVARPPIARPHVPALGVLAALCVVHSARAVERTAPEEATHRPRVLFDFEDDFDQRRVKVRDAAVGLVRGADGVALQVRTGHSRSWPGITLTPSKGRWDLSGFTHVTMDVKNTGCGDMRISGRLDGPGKRFCWGAVWVDKGQTERLHVRIARTPPEDWRVRLFGMRHNPFGIDEEKGIDPTHVVKLSVSVTRPDSDHVFEIDNIRADGRYVPPPSGDPQAFFPMIDEFGQFAHKEWPGKTRTEADLATHRRREAEDLEAHPGPSGWNRYGGWAEGPALEATGFFRTAKHEGKWWLVDPEGRLFWSHGIDCVRWGNAMTPVTNRRHWFENLPGRADPFGQFFRDIKSWAPRGPYVKGKRYLFYDYSAANAFRKYGRAWRETYTDIAHRRLRSWGMNTIGVWSLRRIFLERKTPYVVFVHIDPPRLAGSKGLWRKFPDAFSPEFGKCLAAALEREKGGSAGDPWCLGYFVDNELSWRGPTYLAEATLASPPDQPAKKVFLDDLKAKYATIQKLNEAWGTRHASWEALRAHDKAPDRKKAHADLVSFTGKSADTYFRRCREAVKRTAPKQLYLGCRFFARPDAWTMRAAAPHCDVISINSYWRAAGDVTPPRGVDTPIIIGEFHFGALDRGLFHAGVLPPLPDQQARARAYKDYVAGGLKNPFVVGTHWFQYGDQAASGRIDGENYQIGFLDVCDKPYVETIEACREIGYSLYATRLEDRAEGSSGRGNGQQGAGAKESWPCHGHDASRSGVAGVRLVPPLHMQWQYVPRHPPRPAWPEPGKELNRLQFDLAFHVSVDNDLVYFGSSSEHKVTALDLATGRRRWQFITGGPVRFAPAVAGNRLFVASDDGCVYCLDALRGSEIWRFRGGPRDERMVGNEQMISRWPARAGVLVANEVVYATAGMWSSDGVYVHALRASDGSVIWTNDTCGKMYMGMPHANREGIAGVAPQGYLLLTGNTLVVPNGRCPPAGFDVRTGELLYLRNNWTKMHHAGSSWVVAHDGLTWSGRRSAAYVQHVRLRTRRAPLGLREREFAGSTLLTRREWGGPSPGEGLIAWDARTGDERLALIGKYRAIFNDNTMYAAGRGTIAAIDLKAFAAAAPEFTGTGKTDPDIPESEMTPVLKKRMTRSLYPWHLSKVTPMDTKRFEKWRETVGWTYAMTLAGEVLFAGGRGKVCALRAATGRKIWEAKVDGDVRGLAAVPGRLLVSTSSGRILCFGTDPNSRPNTVSPATRTLEAAPESAHKARRAIEASSIRGGFCLLLGLEEPPGSGRLAAALTRESKLVVYCVDADRRKVAAARRRFDAAGLGGVRVAAHRSRLQPLPYADYFANLVVLDSSMFDQGLPCSVAELYRVLRPWGGVACILTNQPSGIAAILQQGGVPKAEIDRSEGLVRIVRGPLRGAGQWTHPQADAGRTGASNDRLVRVPLKMLWFGRPGPALMVDRHWGMPTPLFAAGRMFTTGEHHVIGVDAYNGRELWRRYLPNLEHYAQRNLAGTIVTDGAHVYVPRGTTCLQLAADTGETVQEYAMPAEARKIPIADNVFRKKWSRPVRNELRWVYAAATRKLLIGAAGWHNFVWSWWTESYPEGRLISSGVGGPNPIRRAGFSSR